MALAPALPARPVMSAIDVVTWLAFGECRTSDQINEQDVAREQRWRIDSPERLRLLVDCLHCRRNGQAWPSDSRAEAELEERFGVFAPSQVTAAADHLSAGKSDPALCALVTAARKELQDWETERKLFSDASAKLLDALRHRRFEIFAIPAEAFQRPSPGTERQRIPWEALLDPELEVVRYDDRIGVDGYREDLPFEHHERKALDWCRPQIETTEVRKWLSMLGVSIAEPSEDLHLQPLKQARVRTQKRVKYEKFETWYEAERVKPAKKAPTEEEDWTAARKKFGETVTRERYVRAARRKFWPVRKQGPRGKKSAE